MPALPPETLLTERIGEQEERLAPEVLKNLGYIHLSSGAPDLPRLLQFLRRCPHVTRLWCGPDKVAIPAEVKEDPQVLPLLRTYWGPLPLAMHLVPGRPLQEVQLRSSAGHNPCSWPAAALRPLVSGTRGVRFANVSDLAFSDTSIQDLAYVFPNVEVLTFAEEGVAAPVSLMTHF